MAAYHEATDADEREDWRSLGYEHGNHVSTDTLSPLPWALLEVQRN